jgi:hypothetical protein
MDRMRILLIFTGDRAKFYQEPSLNVQVADILINFNGLLHINQKVF